MEGSSVENSTSEENLLMQTGTGMRATRAVFLILFLVIGFVGNSVLVATIAQSGRLKSTTLNLFILSVAAVNLLDSLVNLPLVLGASLAEKWTYGSFVCQLSAFCLQLASVVMLFALLMMTLDRFTSLHALRAGSDAHMNTPRANGLIVACWTHGLALSLVILIGVIPVEPFAARYLCSPSGPVNIVYICVVSIFGYILPIILMIAMFVYIIRVCISEKIKDDTSTRKTYTDGSPSAGSNRLYTEINAVKLIGALVLLWCVCEGPFLLLTTVDQFQNSKQLRHIYRANSNNSFTYPWQLDACFTWLRLSYVMVLPVVSVFWCSDVWSKLKKTLSCNKDPLITNIAPNRRQRNKNQDFKRETKSKPKDSPVIKAESRASLRSKKSSDKEKDKEMKSRKFIEKEKDIEEHDFSNGSVPVLFATANGLHYQAASLKNVLDLSDSDAYVTEPETTDTTLTQVLTSRKCDVYGSGLLAGVGEDTSDYDSQMEDPFATSNPVSVKSRGSHSEQELHDLRASSVVESRRTYGETAANPRTDKTLQSTCISDKTVEKRLYDKAQSNGVKKTVVMANGDKSFVKANEPRDKTSHDSGTRSLGNNKKKSKHVRPNDALDHENGNDVISETNCIEVSGIISQNENNTKTKKRRKKKKRKVESSHKDMSISNKCEQTLEENPDKPIVSQPRILPKLNLRNDSTDNILYESGNETQSKNSRPLPEIRLKTSPEMSGKTRNPSELFGIKSAKLPYRQLSDSTTEQSVQYETGAQTERIYGKQFSYEAPTKRAQSARPTPSPRKSLAKQNSSYDVLVRDKSESRMHLLESGVVPADMEGEAFERESVEVQTPVPKARRKCRSENQAENV